MGMSLNISHDFPKCHITMNEANDHCGNLWRGSSPLGHCMEEGVTHSSPSAVIFAVFNFTGNIKAFTPS